MNFAFELPKEAEVVFHVLSEMELINSRKMKEVLS